MTELIVDPHATEILSYTDTISQSSERNDHRLFSESFRMKVSKCIDISNTIYTNYGIDLLQTNGNSEITDQIVDRLDFLSSTYFQHINRNNNHTGSSFADYEEASKPYDTIEPLISMNVDKKPMIEQQFGTDIPSVSIKLPDLIELQLRNNHRLRDALNAYRHQTRHLNSSKKPLMKTIKEDDLLLIDSEPLCPTESDDFLNLSTDTLPKMSTNLRSLMKGFYHQCQNKKSNPSTARINAMVEYIINEEIISEFIQNQIQTNSRSTQSKKLKQNRTKTIEILPYENTYGSFYYPDQSISIDKTMLDKIIRGVQAMAMALTNTKDLEDVLNGTVMLTNQSGSPLVEPSDNRMTDELLNTLQKRFMTRKQPHTSNIERVHLRMILNLILADSRLNGTTLICRSESLIFSCMLRKIRRCIQPRTVCSYGDVITTINEADHQQIRLRTLNRMSLSSDEFIEILGEIYHTSSDTIEAMKYYLEAHDVLDMDTNLLHPSTLTSNDIEEMTKYLLHEDAIRQLKRLVFDRKRHNDSNHEHRQFKLNLPTKLNEFYQPIRKLNAFMSGEQVMTAIRKPYLSQLAQRSKMKAITASDLRAITSQIYLSKEDFDGLIAEKTIAPEIVCQFYTDFHEREDIDERLLKIQKKIQEYANAHSCITRVVLKMLVEHSHGTQLNPFLDQFDQTPRYISIVDLFDDFLQSGLISTTELILSSKQDIIIKKSSLFKHFERISFIRKRDADLLAEISLVIRVDLLIESLSQRATMMKQAYIDCILNNDERRDFVQRNLLPSSKRLSSVSIHQFIHSFNLDLKCGKIFYWMGLADENIVKSLIETKTFVNEYTLDGIYKNFLTRLHDTLESNIYYISAEKLINSDYFANLRRGKDDLCQLGCYITYEQASILVDFADPQYEEQLSSLVILQDIIPREYLKTVSKSANLDELSTIILPKQQVIECKTLLDSFHQRILSRQKRFERITNLQKLLLSPALFDQFIGLIPDLGEAYFTHLELDYLEETKLIDIGVLALLLTLPSYDPSTHQHKYQWFQTSGSQPIVDPALNSLHILEPMIEKYSIFLTTILVRLLSNKERFSSVNEILLSNPDDYLSLEEVLKISLHEHILSHEDLLRICQDIFPTSSPTSTHEQSPDQFSRTSSDTDDPVGKELDPEASALTFPSFLPDCYTRNISMYNNDSIDRRKVEEKFFLAVFDCLLHFNHRPFINGQLQQFFDVFKPLSIYTAQLLIEKEMSIVKLLLKTRKAQSGKLILDDLNRYLQFYPIPCRFDMLNEFRRMKLISQPLTNDYTMKQCHELRSTTAENQSIFLFYMFIRLLREEAYIDELNLQKLLEQYQTKPNAEKILRISKQILRDGFLTLEQILQSTRDFFLQDYFHDHPSSEHRMVIAEQILKNLLEREELTRAQLQSSLSQNIRRREVIPIHQLGLQIKSIKLVREKVQRKVDIVLSKMDDNLPFSSKQTAKFSRMTFGNSTPSEISSEPEQSSPDLRSLRHHYLQARIPRNQLHLLVEQGGWKNEIHLQFKRELDIIDSDNSLELIRHITENISILLKENGSIGEKPLKKHFQQHRSLFLADVEFLLIRYGMVALEDLIDLLVVSKLARAEEIESYAKRIFCLNVNQYRDIAQTQPDSLVRKNQIENHLEKRLCITAVDLSQLLNHVLKLDRLKRIIELMPTIKNYIRLHPLNTFNAVKAFKLEFDFNHYDMKFLRDLKVLNESWYKQYLLSRTSEIGPIVSDIVDDDQEQQERQEFKFRSSSEDDFDPDAFNQLFETHDTQSQMSEQRKQAYLEEMKKRKDQIDSPIPKASSEEDQLQFSVNLDELQKQKSTKSDRPRVIEQFFPNPSILQPPSLVPHFSDQQQRLFIQLDFAKEEYIADDDQHIEGDQRKDVRRQTLIYQDTIGGEEISPMLVVEMDTKEKRRESLPSDEKDALIEDKEEVKEIFVKEKEMPREEQVEEIQLTEQKPSTEIQDQPVVTEQLPETDQSSSSLTEESPAARKSSIIKDDRDSEISTKPIETEPRKSSIKAAELPSTTDQEILSSKSASITLPTVTTNLIESSEQITDIERSSFKQDLKLIRRNIHQWLQQTLQHNMEIKAICTQSDDQSIMQKELLINQLINYLHQEFKIIDQNFISLMLNKYHQSPDWINRFQQRIDQVESILQEKRNHHEIIKHVHQQIHDIDQTIKDLDDHPNKEEILQKYQQYQEDFRRVYERECSEVQPLFGTRLELAIRTLDADLQLIEDTLDGKSPADLMPNTSRITRKITQQPTLSAESEIHDHMILIQTNLSKLTTQIQIPPTTTSEQKISHDLLRRDINDRLQAIKEEYSKQKLNEERMQDIKKQMDALTKLDPDQTDLTDKLQRIHHLLSTQSIQIQDSLSNISAARSRSDHLNVSLNAKLKYLPTDTSGTIIEPSVYLINEQNIPISDSLRMIRAPVPSDRFAISMDQSALTIVDKNQRTLSDPITFRQVSSIPVRFEFVNDDQRRVRMVETPGHELITLNVKPIPADHGSTSQSLFVVDEYDHPLSQPIQLIAQTPSELKLATFLYDDKTNEKVLLTPEQNLIARQQAEWTPRKFLTYIIDKDQIPISEPISISDLGIQLRHSTENVISNKLQFLDNKRQQFLDRWTSSEDKTELLENISSQYKLINSFIDDRLDKLQTEEKVIENIVPLLDNHHDEISDEQLEYKQEQSNMDHLLQTMKSIVQLDAQLTEHRKSAAMNSWEIQQAEKQFIDRLIQISTALPDPKLHRQVQDLTSRFQSTELLTKLRPIVLSGIKTRARAIQSKCEHLLINIYQKSQQLKQPEQIRSEYIQYLSQRFNEETEKQKKMQHFYEKIERMQYDHYQKLADSTQTIELEDLDNQIKDEYNLPSLLIPLSLKTKNEQVIFKFNSILRSLHEALTITEEYEKDLLKELERFSIESSNHDHSSRQQIVFLRNEMQINQYQTLLNYIEKMKTLLNKLETIKDRNLQYYFLYCQLDRFYEILRNHYQIELPAETNIDSIRLSLNNIRRRTRKQLDEYERKRIDLQRKLDVLKMKQELKQRTKITSINEDGLLSSLNAYIQQSQMEPIGIRHQFYAMKIQQITNDFLSEFHHQTSEQQHSLLSILNKTLDHLSSYAEHLETENIQLETKLQTLSEEISIAREYAIADSLVRERIEDLTKQQKIYTHQHDWIIQMKRIVNETYHQLHALFPSDLMRDDSRESFKQLKRNAMKMIAQSAEYHRLSKRVSPQLLTVNQMTSGQELIPAVLPSSRHLFQLPIETRMQQEMPTELFLIQNQSSAIYQQISNLDLESHIRQIEIDYLERQHAHAIAIGDFAQQLAAERAITSKIPLEKQATSTAQISDDTKLADQPETSLISSVVNKKSDIDQQIRGLVKKRMKSLQEQIRTDPLEPLDRKTIRSVEDLRRLNNELKESQEENNRPKQIEVQLQILDRVEQLDHQSTDRNTLADLRQQLYDEQNFVVDSFKISLQQESPTQILPSLPYVLESSFIIGTGETKRENVLEPMLTSVTPDVTSPAGSNEKINVPSTTITAEELYQELQEIRNSIEIAFEGSRPSSDDVDDPLQRKSTVSIGHLEDDINTIRLPDAIGRRSNSIEALDSVLLPIEPPLDPTPISFSETPSPVSNHERAPQGLLLVGNARKYSIHESEAKDRQMPTLTQRSIFRCARDYGEVYVRHRLTSASDSANIDVEREKAEKILRDRIIRKTRLVKFEKTGQGNTVIHQPVGLPTQTFLAPQQATYEENLLMAPPLIQLENTNQSILEEFDGSSWRSQGLFTDDNDESKTSDQQNLPMSLGFPSAGTLSPIEGEESETMETSTGIAFTLTKQDSLTRRRSIQEKEKDSDILTIEDSGSLEKQTLPPITLSLPPEPRPIISQPVIHQEQHTAIVTPPSLSSAPGLQTEDSESRKSKSSKTRSSKKKSPPPENVPLIITTAPDDSLPTENLDVEQKILTPTPVIPESPVIYHKFGLRSKSRKKKKDKKLDTSPKSAKLKSAKLPPISEPAPMVLTPRKAVPFISATKDKQIDVEDDLPTKRKKKRRKRSSKSKRSRSTSRSPSPTRKKKKIKRRRKKKINTDHKTTDGLAEAKPVTNKEAIAMHLLDVKRFTGPPVSPLNLDRSDPKYESVTEILRQPRLKYLKPMLKNFEVDHHPEHAEGIQTMDPCTFNKTLFDFQNDTKDMEQPAMFTEYIPDFFQKQAEEKQIRRISLTAIRTDEHLTKRLAARVPRLYNGYQPSDLPCPHTNEFRPLNKYLMSDISYYFEKDFHDHTGLFQHQKSFDKIAPQMKQPTQRFRDDYIVKEFFNCWRNYTTEKARLAELRRNRVNIDFREFWFQDAFSDPFYSYFEQPPDYRKKQHSQHQMAYRLHKRLVRAGREQPKETMNQTNRSSYLPYLFNLPKNHLDRQGSLTRRRQSIDDDSILLSNLIAQDDDILPLIRERLHHCFPSMNISRYELAIKDLVLHSSIVEQGTLKDLDKLLTDYRMSLTDQSRRTPSNSVVKLPMISQSNSRSSSRLLTNTE